MLLVNWWGCIERVGWDSISRVGWRGRSLVNMSSVHTMTPCYDGLEHAVSGSTLMARTLVLGVTKYMNWRIWPVAVLLTYMVDPSGGGAICSYATAPSDSSWVPSRSQPCSLLLESPWLQVSTQSKAWAWSSLRMFGCMESMERSMLSVRLAWIKKI